MQKTYILKIILGIFIINVFFVFAVTVSFAIDKIGSIDISAENKVKVCKDVTCTDPPPGIIDFEISGDSPLVIDSKNGISGKVWGDELGWITFNPSNGGVFFVDPATGLLKGTAKSENSSVINFSVTGQKVVIDPNTGEWNGWAWASGQYGGWIKFDCKNESCVRTIWHSENVNKDQILVVNQMDSVTELFSKAKEIIGGVLNNFSSSFVNLFIGMKEIVNQKSKIISDDFDIFISRSADLFDKTEQMTSDVYDFLFSYLINFRNSIFEKVDDFTR